MKININEFLVNAYQNESKSIEVSIELFLDSTLINCSEISFQILNNFELKGNKIPYEIKDELIEKIKERSDIFDVNYLVNIFAWMSFQFPEI